MTEVPLLPNRPAQAEGEDDRQQLDRGHEDHGPDDDVEIVLDQHDQLVVAARGHVGVIDVWVLDAVWLAGLYEYLVSSQNTAGLRDLQVRRGQRRNSGKNKGVGWSYLANCFHHKKI